MDARPSLRRAAGTRLPLILHIISMNKTQRNETNEETIDQLSLHSPRPHQQRTPPSTVLWRESPTSLTRDRAPAHRIPKAERFTSTKIDLLKFQQLEALHEARQGSDRAGASFARSTRPDHFAKPATPSPASYQLSRFMDGSKYKAKTERSVSMGSSSKESLRGGTMNQFFNYHKVYLPQSKHRPHQPEDLLDNPSPAHYSPRSTLRRKFIQYSFKTTLRFADAQTNSPGPAAYRPEAEQRRSFNAKGTFPRSNRTYLRHARSATSHILPSRPL